MNSILNLSFNELELELKAYAKEHKVPIIFDEGLAFLETIISIKKPKEILEIGTAIGYSAMRMHEVCGSNITTVERNQEMYNLALENINKANYALNIRIIYKDALEAFNDVADRHYDLIFIDAAKAQYLKFFDLFTPLLNENGLVVCDNMLFHGLVEDKEHYEEQSRSVRGLIRKLNAFHSALIENKDYSTQIFDIGDGVSVSVKR